MKVSFNPKQWEEFKKCIVEDCKIEAGDIVLVHSSIKGMGSMGVTSCEIIEFLLATIGENGTLIFPSYPDLQKMEIKDGSYVFDPETTPPWTGKLCREFLKLDGVVRSRFPHNTLAAKGKLASEMMKNNEDASQYSQGKGSSWDFCIKQNVKILYLGVKAATSDTIVHYAEDILMDEWPVKDWHEEQSYLIKTDTGYRHIITKERRKKWFDYFCMFNTGHILKKKGYLREFDISGVYVGIMDHVLSMSNYYIENAQRGNIVSFKIPKKYLKT